MQGHKNYQEKLFNSFQLSERVPPENFYRRLKTELDLEFLRSLTKSYYGEEGQKSIDPVVFFKLILVGYIENLNSDRKIMNHASMRLDVLYFIGYDIDEELPWHSTLSRTRGLYGEEIFKELFKKVLGLCVSKGMVSGKRQAIDSAFVKANASLDSLVEKEVLEDADVYSDELSTNDEFKQTVTAQKKKEVERHHKWKEEEYKSMPGHNRPFDETTTDEKFRPRYLSNHTHYSATDKDARISTKPGKPRQMNYTAQTVVDTSSYVITTIKAERSDKRDSEVLSSTITEAKNNLEANGLTMEEVLGDGGYSSGEALRYLKQNNIVAYIPNFGLYKPSREGFTYDELSNSYICSQNKTLHFIGIKRHTNGTYYKSYISKVNDCKGCPLLIACTGKSKYKKLTESTDKKYYDEIHQLKESNPKKWQRMKKLRSSTIEPVLGTLINFTGMRRIWTRGIANANKFIIGAAIAYNIKKWMNHKVKKAISIAGALPLVQKGQEHFFLNVLSLFVVVPIFATKNNSEKIAFV